MKIFKVISVKSGSTIQDGFVNKMDAKVVRDQLNAPFNKDRKANDPFRTFGFIVMRDNQHALGASPIPKDINKFYDKPLAIRVTDATRKFYKNK